MEVKLLAHTKLAESFIQELNDQLQLDIFDGRISDGQAVALTAIRTCYSPNEPSEILELEGNKYFKKAATDGQGGTEADRLIRHIMNSGHLSTTEHINFTFVIEGVSRSLLAQLTRHRHFSYSVQSQRYNRYFKDEIKELKDKNTKYANEQKRNGHCKLTIGEELRIIDMYLSGMSTRDISKETGVFHTTIHGIVKAYGIEMRKGNESVVNHNYFEKIDSHKKAQILGFICADGSVGSYDKSKKNEYISHQLGIEEKDIDGYYLQKILNELESRNSLSHTARGTNSICIVSEKIISDLNLLGVTQNKTMTLDLKNIIDKVPHEFINSFMLGYFEGDGYVSKPENSNALIIVTGSKIAAYQLQDIFRDYGLVDGIYVTKDEDAYRVRIHSEKEIEKALCWMYKDIDLNEVLQRKLIIASYSFEGVNKLRKNKLLKIAEDNSFVLPEKIIEKPEVTFTMIDYLNLVKKSYIEMVANGLASEDVRSITGQGSTCNLTFTGNLRSILEFYGKRNPNTHAQLEITQLAEKIKEEVIKAEPWTESFFENKTN